MLEKHRENEVHVDKVEQGPTSSIAFGLERLGLIAVRAPIVSCIILVLCQMVFRRLEGKFAERL